MASIDPSPAVTTESPRTATDFVGLAQLRARAGTDAGAVTGEAARQFEALFVQMMLQSMRSAGDVFGDGSDTTYRDMFDQQIALEMTRGKGLGLADMLVRQIAPPPPTGATLRAPAAHDFVSARQAAPPAPPPARFEFVAPDSADMLRAAALPAFSMTAAGAADGMGTWSDWRPGTPEEFVRDVWPHAARAGSELGVDPRAIVAQAALETGWGRNVARDGHGMSGNNLFNIKADSRWSGERVSVRTLEYEDGVPRQKIAAFRAYPDIRTAVDDYVQFLRGNPRYAQALEHGGEAEGFADSLQAAGYATDPDYAGKLRSILASPRFNDVIGKLKNLVGLPTL